MRYLQKLAPIACALLFLCGCGNSAQTSAKTKFPAQDLPTGTQKIAFIELGAKTCIPCVQMQKVMEQIKAQYDGKVKVVFHDIWVPQGRQLAKTYSIRLIPTQVLLNQQGQEIFRHEGFWPFEEIKSYLQQQDIMPNE